MLFDCGWRWFRIRGASASMERNAGGALLLLRGCRGGGLARAEEHCRPREEDGIEMHGPHDGLEGCERRPQRKKRAEGFFQAAQDNGLEIDGEVGGDLDGGRSAYWMARMDWNSGASGRWKGWRPVAGS